VICDLEELKKFHNWSNIATPRLMHPRLSGGKSVGLISNVRNEVGSVAE